MTEAFVFEPPAVPREGVIGYDFFANFTLVVDRHGGTMTFATWPSIFVFMKAATVRLTQC